MHDELEYQKAKTDAVVTGVGFIVGGKRVPPEQVTMVGFHEIEYGKLDVLAVMKDCAVALANQGASGHAAELSEACAVVEALIEAAGARPVMDGLGFHIEGTTGRHFTDRGAYRYDGARSSAGPFLLPVA